MKVIWPKKPQDMYLIQVDIPPNMVGLYVAETTLNNQKEIKMYTNIIIKFTKILTMFGTIHSHESWWLQTKHYTIMVKWIFQTWKWIWPEEFSSSHKKCTWSMWIFRREWSVNLKLPRRWYNQEEVQIDTNIIVKFHKITNVSRYYFWWCCIIDIWIKRIWCYFIDSM